MPNSTPTPPVSPCLVTPERIEELTDYALTRTFGVQGPRQNDIRHGYLLALEEVMKG